MTSDHSDEEHAQAFSLNAATLIGKVSRYGLKMKDGAATGALELTEIGRDERPHTTYVNIHIWGKAGAAAATQRPPGSLVVLQGTIQPRKVRDQWTLLVAGRELQLLADATEGEYDTESAGRGSAA